MDEGHCNCRVSLQKTLILNNDQKNTLINHARMSAPNESCALLFGTKNNNTYDVKEIFLTKNTEKSPNNFAISNQELIAGYQYAEDNGLDVIGIFHSHPHSEAIPSLTDKKFMEMNPVVWVIFSNKYNELNGFILELNTVQISIKII